MEKLKAFDIFAGIGGFSYGLEKVGMRTVAFCEVDQYCQKILKQYWPSVPIFSDINLLKYHKNHFLYDGKLPRYFTNIDIDVISSSSPCTGYSVAGKKRGDKDGRSKLWKEFARLTREIRPKYCVFENSPNIRNHSMGEILKTFDEIGYNAEWSIISAYSVGAPHQRERLYCVFWRNDIPYPNPFRSWAADPEKEKASSWWWAKRRIKRSPVFNKAGKIEPRVLRFTDGISEELDQTEESLKQLGNSLIPQIPELIGRAIVENERNKG